MRRLLLPRPHESLGVPSQGNSFFTKWYLVGAGPDRKPSSVPLLCRQKGGDDHSSGTTVACCLKRHYPRTTSGPLLMFSYLVLLRMGFTKLSRSPGKLVSSYLAFSPLPVNDRRYIFCGTFLRVTPSRR